MGMLGVGRAYRRWSAWFAAIATVIAGVAATPVTSGSAAAAECVPTALAPFGSTPTPATHEPDAEGYRCFLVTTNDAGPYLVDSGVSRVYRPDGSRVGEVSPGLLQAFLVYELEANTTYRILIPGDEFATYDVLGGEGCPQLPDLSWAAQEDPVDLSHQTACRTATAPAGTILRLRGTTQDEQIVIDGDGDWVCWSQGPSTLAGCPLDRGPGPYRLIAGATGFPQYGPTDMSAIDTSSDGGCERLEPQPWGAPLQEYQRDTTRWECFAFTARTTGTHQLRNLGDIYTSQWARYEVWEEGTGLRYDVYEGNPSIDGARGIHFEAGLEYRILVTGQTSTRERGYHFGIVDFSQRSGCRPIETVWESAPAVGATVNGSLDCYEFAVDEPGKYRLQVERPGEVGSSSVVVAGPDGKIHCGTHAPLGRDTPAPCRLTQPGLYRAVVGRDAHRDPEPGTRGYELYVNEVDSPGCRTIPLAAWNTPLPLVDQADGSAYQCYTVTTGASTRYSLSRWREQWSPRYSLWAVDPESQRGHDQGLPLVDAPLELLPHTTYRIVLSGDREHASGEHRLGLFEEADLAGCPPIDDLRWSAPPVVGTTTKGEVDCRSLPNEPGELFYLDERHSRIHGLGTTYCPHEMCTLEGQGPWRVITSADGDYQYRVHRVADVTGCPSVSVAPEARPLHASVEAEGRACFAVDLQAGLLKPLVDVRGGEGRVRLYDLSNGRECDLEYEKFCSVRAGRHVVVMDHTSATAAKIDVDVLLRQHTASSVGCEQMTTARVTGELSGRFDEECYTLTAPEGTLFAVTEAAGDSIEPDLKVYGPDGSHICSGPFTDECRAPGGRMTISMINKADTTGPFALQVGPVHTGFSFPPTMRGRAVVGSRLRVDVGQLDPNHATAAVAWLKRGKVVGRGRTYRPTARDAGKVLRARVTVSSPGYADSAVFLRSDRVRKGAIRYEGRYAIRGTPRVGGRLAARVGDRKVAPGGVRVAYRWLRNGSRIRGATGPTYRVRRGDRGAVVKCRAVLTKSGYQRRTLRTDGVRVR